MVIHHARQRGNNSLVVVVPYEENRVLLYANIFEHFPVLWPHLGNIITPFYDGGAHDDDGRDDDEVPRVEFRVNGLQETSISLSQLTRGQEDQDFVRGALATFKKGHDALTAEIGDTLENAVFFPNTTRLADCYRTASIGGTRVFFILYGLAERNGNPGATFADVENFLQRRIGELQPPPPPPPPPAWKIILEALKRILEKTFKAFKRILKKTWKFLLLLLFLLGIALAVKHLYLPWIEEQKKQVEALEKEKIFDKMIEKIETLGAGHGEPSAVDNYAECNEKKIEVKNLARKAILNTEKLGWDKSRTEKAHSRIQKALETSEKAIEKYHAACVVLHIREESQKIVRTLGRSSAVDNYSGETGYEAKIAQVQKLISDGRSAILNLAEGLESTGKDDTKYLPANFGKAVDAVKEAETKIKKYFGECAILYYVKNVHSKEKEEAFSVLERAATKIESSAAQYMLGRAYERGLLRQKSDENALHWYKLSAAQGYSEAKKAVTRLEAQTSSN
jgi:tetratricopeptide (TPR) repeat protein